MHPNDIRSAIWSRWPSDKWLKITEAPTPDRERRIDMLCLSILAPTIDAVEIKTSIENLRAELAEPAKSEFWRRHSHHFWLAMPADEFSIVADEVPEHWGVITVGNASRVARTFREPRRNIAEPIEDHRHWVAVMSTGMRQAHDIGYAEGLEDSGVTGSPRAYYTIGEAAHILHCSKRTVFRAIKDGRIPVVDDLLGQRRIPARQFDQLLEGSTLT